MYTEKWNQTPQVSYATQRPSQKPKKVFKQAQMSKHIDKHHRTVTQDSWKIQDTAMISSSLRQPSMADEKNA